MWATRKHSSKLVDCSNIHGYAKYDLYGFIYPNEYEMYDGAMMRASVYNK